ncbi:LCP family protein [Streptomyces sp. NPDC005438]|uniref:LCP family protein n=1 Tax=Streptomyces sp. NPDC005438 TaxID=3156880 RepID=UPI00339E82C1
MRHNDRTEQGVRRRVPAPRGQGRDGDIPGRQRPDRSARSHDAPRRDHGGASEGDADTPGSGPSGGGSADGGRRRPRRKRRVLLWFAGGLALLILVTAGGGYLYYEHLNGNLTKDALNLGDSKLNKTNPNSEGQTPLNILLLGSDSRNSDRNAKLGGSHIDRGREPLADVQMLLHVSADRSNMSVLSIPRDTRVEVPKCTDTDDGKVYKPMTERINTSLQRGGPGCTVATWENLTGIPIDHFMMIDFAGVVSMADAVGGVPVCVDRNVHDRQSQLKLKKGTSVVKGEQALHWLRTRHGFGDGTDIGRARAQHMYMNSMVRELKAGTKLRDPGKMRNLAEAATKALTVDEGIGTVRKLYDLGNDLKRVPTKRITMATMPWVYSSGGTVVPKEREADQVFSMIRHDVALDGRDKKSKKPEPTKTSTPKEELSVRVMNGTATAARPAVPGRASTITDALKAKGYERSAADQTPNPQTDTTVSYAEREQRGDALALAKAMGLPEKAVKHSSGVSEVTLVVGADWREGKSFPAAEGGGKGGGDEDKTPDSADALNGSDRKACMKVNPQYSW